VLTEELDFRAEARYQELFRRYLRRRKKFNMTAPKVYHELSGRDVIVSEFVEGLSVRSMLARMNAEGEEYLAQLRSQDIVPRRIAKRLVRASYYQFHECPFFHGDPHPGNILVQPGNRIVMVDFGACGVFGAKDRNLMLQLNAYQARGDVAGMVECVIGLMEPLPRIDVDAFRKYVQDEWWKGYYGIKSKHADWSERTSFRLWVALLRAFRKFAIPLPLHMLRMIRATLLYDTVAAQLYGRIDVFKEFAKYRRGVARRTRTRIQESVVRQFLMGPDDSKYVKLQRIADVGNTLLFRAEQFLAEPGVGLKAVVGKVYALIDSIVEVVKTAVMFTVAAWLFGLIVMAGRKLTGAGEWDWNLWHVVWPQGNVPPSRPLQAIALVWAMLLVLTLWSRTRRTLFEFERKDDYARTVRS
jgi:predicted unusual protein kinase regulating ubiquinone biosynthesis (AarF/ABC1/UbiB family)